MSTEEYTPEFQMMGQQMQFGTQLSAVPLTSWGGLCDLSHYGSVFDSSESLGLMCKWSDLQESGLNLASCPCILRTAQAPVSQWGHGRMPSGERWFGQWVWGRGSLKVDEAFADYRTAGKSRKRLDHSFLTWEMWTVHLSSEGLSWAPSEIKEVDVCLCSLLNHLIISLGAFSLLIFAYFFIFSSGIFLHFSWAFFAPQTWHLIPSVWTWDCVRIHLEDCGHFQALFTIVLGTSV